MGISDGRVSRLIAAIEDVVPEVLALHGVPGINLAIGTGGEVVYEAGFGFADVGKDVPMTADTITRSGSFGKGYTSTAVMQLVEQGVLGLHEPVNTYLAPAGVKLDNPLGPRDVTVHDLLTHRSGLAANTAGSMAHHPPPLRDHLAASYGNNEQDVYRGSLTPKWSLPVGETFNYSNTGMGTLGLLVEVTNPDGLSFTDYVQRYICDPLDMRSTQYPRIQDPPFARDDLLARVSTGYAGFGNVNVGTPRVYFGDYPAGNVLTTPGDQVRLGLAYIGDGELDGGRVLGAETVAQMLTPQVDGALYGRQPEITMGLGWFLGNVGQRHEYFCHGGAHMFGWNNDFRVYRELDCSIAIFSNRWDMITMALGANRVTDFIGNWLAGDDYGLPEPPAKDWAWKRGYLMGLVMAINLHGFLGLDPPLDDDGVLALLDAEAEIGPAVTWAREGFVEGFRDLVTHGGDLTAQAIGAFVCSDKCRIRHADITLLHAQLDGVPYMPLSPTGGFVPPYAEAPPDS